MQASFDPRILMVFYPLFAAVGAMLFWGGVLSQRVKTLEKVADGIMALGATVAKLEHTTSTLNTEGDRLRQSIESVQRQIANLMLRLPVAGIIHGEDHGRG